MSFDNIFGKFTNVTNTLDYNSPVDLILIFLEKYTQTLLITGKLIIQSLREGNWVYCEKKTRGDIWKVKNIRGKIFISIGICFYWKYAQLFLCTDSYKTFIIYMIIISTMVLFEKKTKQMFRKYEKICSNVKQ